MAIEKRKEKVGYVYYVCLKVNGKKKRWRAGISKTIAKKMQERFKMEIAEGTYFEKERKCNLTFKELAKRYMEVGMPEGTTVLRYRSILEGHLIPSFGSKLAIDITPGMVEIYKKKRKDESVKTATINLDLNCMSAVYTWAIRKERILKDNPLTFVKRDNPNNIRDRIITEVEYARILDKSPEYLKPIIITAWNTAMRVREILNLTWDNINLDKRIIVLKAEQTKGKEERIIPMNDIVFKLFNQLSKVSYLGVTNIFTFRGKPLDSVDRAFERAVNDARIEDFHFHDIRHCAITRWRREGKDYLSIRKITGHKTMQVFERYNSFDLDDLRKVVNEMSTYLPTNENTPVTYPMQDVVNQSFTHAGIVQR